MIAWIWISLTSCSYSPNYSKVDASNHSITNYNYSARQMAVGIPNHGGDSMVSTTTEEGEDTSQEPTVIQSTAYPPTRFERPPSSPPSPRKYDTSYIIPNPFTASRGSYIYQPNRNSYATTYQQSLQRQGIYGPRNSLEAQAYCNTAQALNRNRY